jgi:hypothetical protein
MARTPPSRSDAGRFLDCTPDTMCSPASTHMFRRRIPDTKSRISCPSPRAQSPVHTSHSPWNLLLTERSQIHSEGTMSLRSRTGSVLACTSRRSTLHSALGHIRDDTSRRPFRCSPPETIPVHTFHRQPFPGATRTARVHTAHTLSDPRPVAHIRADTHGTTWILAPTARTRPCMTNMC